MPAGGPSTNRGWLQEGVIRGTMLGRTILPSDEELGKKDDDHKPGAASAMRMPQWPAVHGLIHGKLRWRRRRILAAVVALYLFYLALQHMPLGGSARYPIVSMPDDTYAYNLEPTGPPPGLRLAKEPGADQHAYEGHIKFYRLAASLHSASHTNGYRSVNRNVLFAVSNLKSAASLLPMVCEMAKWSRNYVHAAFMGREDIPLEDLLDINGIDSVKCPVMWHDARPDYAEYSSDTRAESSVVAAMTHINSFLHPQVAIMDDSLVEDAFFVRGMRSKTKALDMPLIELPKDGYEDFMWMARLDSGSLKSWHLPTVDILIQVPPDSSSVLRLLKSLKQANYDGMKLPRITIDLPANVDVSVKQYLENFRWPPANDNPLAGSQLTVRRRIASQHATQEESAIRFLELFYPTSITNSHVLLLSPQAQLSPQYYHYLRYLLLEYRYSSYGEDDGARVMGVSLELPSTLLDGKSKLKPPKLKDMHTSRYQELFPETSSTHFLWQAPNSHATLFFGDKWAELHSFLSNRVAKHLQSPDAPARPKLVSETLPSWMEYLLELMRARGYSLFYPAAASSESLVTIHNELYTVPEEFRARPAPAAAQADADAEAPPKPTHEAFLRAPTPPSKPKNPEPPTLPNSRPLHLALPFEGDLPEIPHLPQLLYDGRVIAPENVTARAKAYADEFREVVGGCKMREGKHRVMEAGSARDLFCLGDEDEGDWEEDSVDAEDGNVFEASVVDDYLGASESDVASGVGGREKVVGVATATATATATSTSTTMVSKARGKGQVSRGAEE
ncbi:hypothetical protein BS50DRAFT_578113 [Corynespora cassiicola Philippines]|uniref:Glycosyltransferase 2 n=1 Tax=Corynespora cassiicola Philippines TaxID=1448308 RepID=A0A2T2NA23_CORCC|nr:hypothetical protein BS50DRAFT_578113 [Corynespora cassiicola Philippines]